MVEPYNLRVELSRGAHRKAANLSVSEDAMSALEMIGQNALVEAVSEIVIRMQTSIREDENDANDDVGPEQ